MPWGFLKDLVLQSGLELYIAFTAFLLIKLYPSLKAYYEKVDTLKKDEFETLISIISDKNKVNKRFLLEQAIELKYKKAISWREINYLLRMDSPSESLARYMSCRHLLQFGIKDKHPQFKASMNTKTKRCIKYSWNVFWYFLFTITAIAMIPISIWLFEQKGPNWFIGSALFLFYCLGIAYQCILEASEVSKSKSFMEAVDLARYDKN